MQSGSPERLKWRMKLYASGKILINKVCYYAQIGVILCTRWCNVIALLGVMLCAPCHNAHVCSVRVQHTLHKGLMSR